MNEEKGRLRFGNLDDIILAKYAEIDTLENEINVLLKEIDTDELEIGNPLEEEMKKIYSIIAIRKEEKIFIWRKKRGFKNP